MGGSGKKDERNIYSFSTFIVMVIWPLYIGAYILGGNKYIIVTVKIYIGKSQIVLIVRLLGSLDFK